MRPLSPEEQRLVVRALWIVHQLAPRIARQWPLTREDDLRSLGNQVLVEHVGSWDESTGVSYDAYVYKRIWGAMLDHAHQLTFGLERMVHTIVGCELRSDAVGPGTSVPATSDEGRRHAVQDMRARTAELAAATLLTEPMTVGGEEEIIELQTQDRCRPLLTDTLALMPDAEAKFVHWFHGEGLSKQEIAKRLGVSTKTVQRLHVSVRGKLRVALDLEMLRDGM